MTLYIRQLTPKKYYLSERVVINGQFDWKNIAKLTEYQSRQLLTMPIIRYREPKTIEQETRGRMRDE